MNISILEKATNEQLWCICNYDQSVPKELLEPIVIEGLNRGLFDHLIKHIMKRMFRNLHSFLYEVNMTKEELIQIGRIAIYEATQHYSNHHESSFNTFAYIHIKYAFGKVLERHGSQKRQVYKYTQSLEQKLYDDSEDSDYYYLKDFRYDTEKEALFNIEWEQALSLLNKREKIIIQYLVKGYTLGEIALFLNLKASSRSSLHRSLHKSFKKINPAAPKVNLHEWGLVCRRKEELLH